MTDDEEVDYLWGLALGKKSGWQYSDYPVVKDKLPKFAEAWKKSKKKTQYKTGNSITVKMVEQYWIAESRQRRTDRERKVKVSQPVGATVWLNDERWNNGVEAETQEIKREANKCHCGKDVHGPSFKECTECMNFEDGKLKGWEAEKMRDYFKKNNIEFGKLNNLTPSQQIYAIKQLLAGNKNIQLDKQQSKME